MKQSAVLRETSWEKLARIISEMMNPVFVAVPTFLLISLYTAPDLWHGLLWWVITVVGISLVPFLFILLGVRRGRYSDHHVSIREQRLIPLLFALGCTGLVFVFLLFLHVSSSLIATLTALLITGALALAITRYWKISFHLVGVAGAITVCGLVLGPLFYLLAPLVLIVGWARWRVGAHTPLQALAGTALAVGVTVITFWLFRILC